MAGMKRKIEATAAVTPELIAQVFQVVSENDGQISGGRISSSIPGLKKSQLEQIASENGQIVLKPPGAEHRDFFVMFPGVEFDPSKVPASKSQGGEQEQLAKKQKSEETPRDLDIATANEITQAISTTGGYMSCAQLANIYGVNRLQLAGHFGTIHPAGASGAYVVLPGYTMPDVAALQLSTPAFEGSAEELGPPLDAEVASNVGQAIEANGGWISGGRLSSQFEGMKKASLANHFDIKENPTGGREFYVLLPGHELPANAVPPKGQQKNKQQGMMKPGGMGGIRPQNMQGRMQQMQQRGGLMNFQTMGQMPRSGGFNLMQQPQRGNQMMLQNFGQMQRAGQPKRSQPVVMQSTDPSVPLNQGIVQQITNAVQQAGGYMCGGRLTTLFQGVKRAQLEQQFEVQQFEGYRDFWVVLPGFQVPQNALVSKAAPVGGSQVRSGAMPMPQAGGQAPALAPHVVQQIKEFIDSNGGTVAGGILTTKFPGVKKAQLAINFQLSASPTNSDFIVSSIF